MLRLIYAEDIAGPDGTQGDWLRAADNTMLQQFPRDQAGYAPPASGLIQVIHDWLAQRGAQDEPVVVMVHGFMFDPSKPANDPGSPFDSVYGLPPAVDYHLSWLPLVGECDQSGGNQADNAIAFCYKSIGSDSDIVNAGWNNPYQHAVFDLAPRAARALASILGSIVNQTPTIRILAHSLGTRTTGQAIRLARARLLNSLDRIVNLGGAEFCVDAAAEFAGCEYDVFNLVNRNDSVLRWGAEQFCHPFRVVGTLPSCVIGYEGLGDNQRWLDLQLDNSNLAAWLAAGNAPDGLPYTLQPQANEDSHSFAGLDHWAYYTNDGNRALVKDLVGSKLMTVARMTAFRAPGGTNAPAYGRFNDQPVPVTPMSVTDRRRLLAQSQAPAGGGG